MSRLSLVMVGLLLSFNAIAGVITVPVTEECKDVVTVDEDYITGDVSSSYSNNILGSVVMDVGNPAGIYWGFISSSRMSDTDDQITFLFEDGTVITKNNQSRGYDSDGAPVNILLSLSDINMFREKTLSKVRVVTDPFVFNADDVKKTFSCFR